MKKNVARTIWKSYPFFYDLATLHGIPYLEMVKTTTDCLWGFLDRHPVNMPIIIDACCGTGNYTWAIKNKIPNSKIKGIDFTAEMIARARKKGAGVDFEISDLNEALGKLETASVDALILMNGFYPLPKKEESLRQIARVMKPGGLFILSDPKKGANLLGLLKSHWEKGSWKDRMILPVFLFAVIISALLQYGVKYPFVEPETIETALCKNRFQILEKRTVYANQNFMLIATREKQP